MVSSCAWFRGTSHLYANVFYLMEVFPKMLHDWSGCFPSGLKRPLNLNSLSVSSLGHPSLSATSSSVLITMAHKCNTQNSIPMHKTQFSIHKTKFSIHKVQYTKFNTQNSIHKIRYTKFYTQNSTHKTQSQYTKRNS